MQSAYSVPGRRRRRGRRRCRDAPIGAPPEGNAKEVIRRRRRVTMAASNDDSVVAHSSLPAASRISPSSVVCSTTPLAQTFPQLAQHVVERGALTHSHDSERSSLCSQRGSLARALSSLRSVSPSLRSAHRFALLLSFFANSPVFALENRFARPRFRPYPDTNRSPPSRATTHIALLVLESSDHTHRCANALGWCVVTLGWCVGPSYKEVDSSDDEADVSFIPHLKW